MTDAYNERDGLAAEYVLGTLEAVARREAEALAARNPAFAELVAEWERRLAPLAEDIQAVAPPAGLLARIENILDILGPVRGAAPMALYVAVTELIPEAPQTRTVAVLNQAAATPAMMVSLDLTAGRMIVRPLTETETGLARQLAAGEKSLELWLVPPAGSPSGAPTGPVIYQGAVLPSAG